MKDKLKRHREWTSPLGPPEGWSPSASFSFESTLQGLLVFLVFCLLLLQPWPELCHCFRQPGYRVGEDGAHPHQCHRQTSPKSTHTPLPASPKQQTQDRMPKTRLAARSRPIPAQTNQIAILFMAPALLMSGPPDTIRWNKTESHLRGCVGIAGGSSRMQVMTEPGRQRHPERNNSVVDAASQARQRFVLPMSPQKSICFAATP